MAEVNRAIQADTEFQRVVADLFRKARWKVRGGGSNGNGRPDLVAQSGGKKYVIELKVSSEGRRDRLIPLLSQAILQAQAYARGFPDQAVPVAVVAARRIPASVAEQVKQFAERNAPDVGVGVIDAAGLRTFSGHGLEKFDAKPAQRERVQAASPPTLPNLFSDLNQWMLKILLGQRLSESLLAVPRGPLGNATQLAAAANVSVMTAFRFVSQLARQGFLDEDAEQLRIVRVEELMEQWAAANRQAWKEIPARWIVKKGPQQLHSALQEYVSPPTPGPTTSRDRRRGEIVKILPRCCAGLFAAADFLGFGFVRGAAPHIYLERLTLDALFRLGLLVDYSDRPSDLYIRIPVSSEAIFRASVLRQSVPVSDVLQVWLDASTYPARGREQANEIRRRVLGPLFKKK